MHKQKDEKWVKKQKNAEEGQCEENKEVERDSEQVTAR